MNEYLYLARMLTYIPGEPLAKFEPYSLQLSYRIGRFLGELDNALSTLDSSKEEVTDFRWHPDYVSRLLPQYISYLERESLQQGAERWIDKWETVVDPLLPTLRRQVIHNDPNDYNLIIEQNQFGKEERIGLIDFGEMVATYLVAEIGVTIAYHMFYKEAPLKTAVALLRGYHETCPLTEVEIGVLYYFIQMRLYMSLLICNYEQLVDPANRYLSISGKPIRHLLQQLAQFSDDEITAIFREAIHGEG